MIWYYILALFAQIIEGFAGFGSTAMALPFLSIALGTSAAVALLSLNSLVSGSVIFLTSLKQVNWKEYLKVTLCVVPFLPLGVLIYSALARYEAALKLILGITIAAAGARGAWYSFVKKREPPALGRPAQYAALAAGALVQGMFSAGGPLIVIYTNEQLKDKSAFRATMSALWCTVNSIGLILRLMMLDIYDVATFKTFLTCLPVLAAGVVIGTLLHKRVNNANFRKAVFLIMLAGGISSTAYCLAGLLSQIPG